MKTNKKWQKCISKHKVALFTLNLPHCSMMYHAPNTRDMEKIQLIRNYQWNTLILREKYPFSECFWPVFSPIRTEYGDLLCKYLHSVWMRENKDQENSRYGHFLCSDNQRNQNGKMSTKSPIPLKRSGIEATDSIYHNRTSCLYIKLS